MAKVELMDHGGIVMGTMQPGFSRRRESPGAKATDEAAYALIQRYLAK